MVFESRGYGFITFRDEIAATYLLKKEYVCGAAALLLTNIDTTKYILLASASLAREHSARAPHADYYSRL